MVAVLWLRCFGGAWAVRYHYGHEGTCECTDRYCIEQNETCCRAGDAATFEGRSNHVVGNAMERFQVCQSVAPP